MLWRIYKLTGWLIWFGPSWARFRKWLLEKLPGWHAWRNWLCVGPYRCWCCARSASSPASCCIARSIFSTVTG